MCTSFNLGGDFIENLKVDLMKFDREEYLKYVNKDIYPSNKAIVIKGEEDKRALDILDFGYEGFKKNSLLLNARSETVLEKKTFMDDVRKSRLVVPMSKFYEWNYLKERSEFYPLDDDLLFACGFTNGERFVIITRDANEIVSPIHNRMPLLIERNRIDDWIFDDNLFTKMLGEDLVKIERRSDFEQISFL